MQFHIVYDADVMDADIEAHDIAVDDKGNLLFLADENTVVRQIAAGKWIEWRVIDGL